MIDDPRIARLLHSGWWGFFLYVLPLLMCLTGYTVRTARNYMQDRADREEHLRNPVTNYYSPTDTVGSLVGRAIVSILPVLNLWAAMFDVSPEFFWHLFNLIERVFSQPLVPRPRKEKDDA